MNKSKILILIFFISSLLQAQRLYKVTVDNEGVPSNLSFITRNGVDYVSSRELTVLMGASIFYNEETAKVELKFSDYIIKFTAKSNFIVITNRTDKSFNTFQIFTAPLLLKDDIFIPLNASLEYLAAVHGKMLDYNDRTKKLTLTKNIVNYSSLFTKSQPDQPNKKDSAPVKSASSFSKYDIENILIEEKSNGTLIRFKTNKKLNIPRNSIGNGILFVFFPNISVIPGLAEKVIPAGLVKSVKQTLMPQNITQLEFLLNEGYSGADSFIEPESNDIVITLRNQLFVGSKETTDQKKKWLFDVIVIDAGHGGKDPGAIGVTGVREKDINLAIALKLGGLIQQNLPEVKVVYTRKTDQFVELYKRGKIANENEGKLFISIHCNSTVQKDIAHRGFEVYLLRPGRTESAIKIAEFENSVIKYEENPDRYQKLTDENFILVSMAHSQYMRFSEKFSDLLNSDWKKYTSIPSLGIKQAGFYVLVGASMPSVLIETGFLSNRKDETYLASTKGQNEIATAIYKAIARYKEYYDKEITLQ
ncbi:MAG: N-acetylmuramoyl-L-alanine amidase [Melioribacteraceae bacterium]|nr:N-acetylmuramoyl-L-alanine amidase [Melioribacteraceae bacterium]